MIKAEWKSLTGPEMIGFVKVEIGSISGST